MHPLDEAFGAMSTSDLAHHLQLALLTYNDTGFKGSQWEPKSAAHVRYHASGSPIYLADVPSIFRQCYDIHPERPDSLLSDEDIWDAFAFMMRYRLVVFDTEFMCAFAAAHAKEDEGYK